MNIRRATAADQPMLRELWEEFEAEIPAPPEFVETWDEEWQDVSADIGGRGVVYLAEDDDGVIGAVRGTMLPGDVWHIVFAHVRPRARRQGLLKRLMSPVIEEGRSRGSTRVTLDVMVDNHAAVAAWKRLGFEQAKWYMAAPLDKVAERTAVGEHRPSRGATYVQTDDHDVVERAVAKYLPRIGHSETTAVAQPSNGWTRVDDELCSRDPERSAGSAASCPSRSARSSSPSASRRARSSVTSSGTAAAWPTSTRRCPSTSPSCRPATSSRWPPTRRSRTD